MERSRRLLLVAGLLAALLPEAAAAFGPQPGAPCEPTLLATQVAIFSAPDFPTAQCCEPVVAAVDLSGCVPCLCRVPAEPQLVMAGLNATHLALYSSCGGPRPGGAHLAAACEAHAPPAAVVSSPLPPHPSPAARRRKQTADARPPQQLYCAASSPNTTCGGLRPGARLAFACKVVGHTPLGAVFSSFRPRSPPRRKLRELKCDPFSLGSNLVSACGDDQHPCLPCCEYIINTVDEDCVCDVIEVPEVMGAAIGVSRIWTFYGICGGTKPVPADTTVCREQSPPPPPPVSPPPPPPSQGPPATTDDSAMNKYMDKITHTLTESIVSSYAMGGLLVVSVGTGIAVWAWKQYSDKHREPGQHPHGEVEMPPVQNIRQSSIIGTAATRHRRQVAPAPTTVPTASPVSTASAPPVPAATAPPEPVQPRASRVAIAE